VDTGDQQKQKRRPLARHQAAKAKDTLVDGTEIATYRARWPLGAKERTAFELFLNTGQRRSDVIRMAWSHIADGKIRVEQQKTGRVLLIPLHRELIAALAHAERAHVAILTTVALGRVDDRIN
jgi:integrase